MAAVPSPACVPAEAAKHVKTRSSRTVRAAVPFSPDVKLTPRRKKKKAANKEPTCCKKCGITLRGSTKHLCAACCEPSLDVGPEEAESNQEFEENKKKYLDEAKAFAANLAKVFDDVNAERLFCPVFKPKGPCACIQEYLSGDGLEQRVRSLLQLLQEAKKLSQQKCYNWEEVKRVGKSHAVGMGNGQKHSESFELFVNEHRPRLRELKLCERATQKVLLYSNNFLHRNLKTEPNKGRRIQRTKGQGGTWEAEEPGPTCRGQGVVQQRWARPENRRVLAEMLTPSGPNSTNCYKFISWVTGCSFTTIAKVSKQMLATGGDREPPPHKLKKFWDAKNTTQEESVQNETL
ncbi:hypothetical protein MTO96_027119 [Rhipicephalus appendiculatus]